MQLWVRREGEIEALNGLRSLAILFVFTYHSLVPAYAAFPGLESYAEYFKRGVDLFFVISGFLITEMLLRQERGSDGIVTFFARRTLRIFPAYYVFLVIVYLIYLYRFNSLSPSDPGYPILRALLANSWSDFFYLSNYFPGLHGHTWSLAVEEQYYLIYPFLFPLALKVRSRFLQAGGFIFLFLVPLAARVYYGSHLPYETAKDVTYYRFECRFDALLTGILCAWIYRRPFFKEIAKRSFFLSAGALLLLGLGFFLPPLLSPFVRMTYYFDLIYAGFALLLLASLAESSAVSRFFSSPIFRPLARLSYSFYLWHMAATLFAVHRLHLMIRPSELTVKHTGIIWAAGFAASLVCSIVSFYLVERPVLLFRYRFFAGKKKQSGSL